HGYPGPEALGDSVVDALRGQRLGGVGVVAGLLVDLCLTVLLAGRHCVLEQSRHLGALSGEPLACHALVHLTHLTSDNRTGFPNPRHLTHRGDCWLTDPAVRPGCATRPCDPAVRLRSAGALVIG